MIGDNIKKLRSSKGWKQSDLAEKTGISSVSIGNYERNDRVPPVDLAKKIAVALGVSLDLLLGSESNEFTMGELHSLPDAERRVYIDNLVNENPDIAAKVNKVLDFIPLYEQIKRINERIAANHNVSVETVDKVLATANLEAHTLGIEKDVYYAIIYDAYRYFNLQDSTKEGETNA